MKAVTVKTLKDELKYQTQEELVELCLTLAKFKKENKELLTYLLFEASDKDSFIATVQTEMDALFKTVNTKSYFYMKKTIRKILRMTKTNIRYAKDKAVEIELLLYFCKKLKEIRPSIQYSNVLKNLYERELIAIEKKINAVHEDLQYDYFKELEELSF